MAQLPPIEVLITTTADVDKALAARDTLVARVFGLGLALGLLFGWLATWIAWRLS